MKKQKESSSHKVNISVIGGGSWATAIVKILTCNHHNIKWWVRQAETAEHIRKYHHNPKYLSSVEFALPEGSVTNNIHKSIEGADYLVIAVPSAYLKQSLEGLKPEDLAGKKIISAVKGLVQPENQSVSQYLHQVYGIPFSDLANISGPCHAEEVAAEKLSYLTFSSPNIDLAQDVAAIFRCRFLNTTYCEDLLGTEFASVMKNVIALSAGISVGLGYGDNFRAVLVSEGMREMQIFLDAVNPYPRNILAPAYLGDTLVTAYSQYSRNRTFGLMIGKGYSIQAAILELNMVAEGYYATKTLNDLANKLNLNLPILKATYHILYEKHSPSLEFRLLTEML